MHIEDIRYDVNGERMVGHLAFDDQRRGTKPAVLVSHEGPGLDGHAKAIAEKLRKNLSGQSQQGIAKNTAGGDAGVPATPFREKI